MYSLYYVEAAIIAQCLAECMFKERSLFNGRLWCFCMKDCVDKLLVNFGGVPRIEQCVINIRRPIIKGWKQKAEFRCCYCGVGNNVLELFLLERVTQGRFIRFDWAYSADNVGEHGIGSIALYCVILATIGTS